MDSNWVEEVIYLLQVAPSLFNKDRGLAQDEGMYKSKELMWCEARDRVIQAITTVNKVKSKDYVRCNESKKGISLALDIRNELTLDESVVAIVADRERVAENAVAAFLRAAIEAGINVGHDHAILVIADEIRLAAVNLEDNEKPEAKRIYILDRYHNGMRMAEGARVTASSLEEAIEKARHLPGIPSFMSDEFRERPVKGV